MLLLRQLLSFLFLQAPSAGQTPITGGTPHTDHVVASGLGSAMTFDEDASIGPEPILFTRNFGGLPNPGGTQDPHVSIPSSVPCLYLTTSIQLPLCGPPWTTLTRTPQSAHSRPCSRATSGACPTLAALRILTRASFA